MNPMKTIPYLFLLTTSLSSLLSTAHAGTPSPKTALTCTQADRPRITLSLVVRGTKTVLEMKDGAESDSFASYLLGKSNYCATKGPFAGADPILGFTNFPVGGEINQRVTLEVALNPRPGTRKHAALAVWDHSLMKDLICNEGPAYPEVAARAKTAPWISQVEIDEQSDEILSLSCRDPKTGKIARQIRGMYYGHADVEVQVKGLDGGYPIEDLENYDRYARNGSEIAYFDDPGKNRVVLKTEARRVDGKLGHDVFFKESNGNEMTLFCEERSAYRNLLLPVEYSETHRRIESLPAPGKLADLSDEFCAPNADHFEKATNVMDKYADLIADLPGYSGMWIDETPAKKHPLRKSCTAIGISAETEAQLKSFRAKLGQSLDGVYLIYEVKEIASAQ